MQDALLLEAVGKFGHDWVDVAAGVSEGSDCVVNNRQCNHRYHDRLNPELQKLNNRDWTEAEVITTHP
jgi:hypothetical protein